MAAAKPWFPTPWLLDLQTSPSHKQQLLVFGHCQSLGATLDFSLSLVPHIQSLANSVSSAFKIKSYLTTFDHICGYSRLQVAIIPPLDHCNCLYLLFTVSLLASLPPYQSLFLRADREMFSNANQVPVFCPKPWNIFPSQSEQKPNSLPGVRRSDTSCPSPSPSPTSSPHPSHSLCSFAFPWTPRMPPSQGLSTG